MPAPNRRGQPRLGVERLEDRAVPAAAFDPSRVLVTFADPADHLAELRLTPIAASAGKLTPGVYKVDLAPGASVAGAVAAFGKVPGVRAAQPDYRVTPAAVPNDPQFAQQWAHTSTSAAAAWSVSAGTGNTIVAVLDTGINAAHPDLAPNLWRNPREVPGNGRDDDGNGFTDDVHGANFQTNTGNPVDDVGHGTHVAGIIGASGNNATGVAGVLWRTRLMALKFMGPDGGFTSDAVRAVDYAIANGAKVLNASWGGNGPDPALAAAFDRARSAGVIVVAAAGNSGANTDATPFYPANYVRGLDNVVTVAAMTQSGALAPFSNFGAATVTLAAPGESILSTTYGGGYGTKSGTSMATPHVAGAIALAWDAHPEWSYRQVLAKLKQSVDVSPALAAKTATGGRLNLAKLLEATSPPTTDRTGPRVTGAVVSGPSIGAFDRATIAFSEPVEATTIVRSVAIGTPGGSVVMASAALPIVGTNNTQFTVMFSKLMTTPGSYTLTVSYLIRDLAGNGLDQNGNAVNGETTDWFTQSATLTGPVVPPPPASATRVTFGALGPRTIADRRTTRVELVVNRDLTIADLTVHLDLAHGRTSDLNIRLTAPNGQRVTLFNRRGSGANLTNTVFADGAAMSLASAAAPFTGTVRPEQALSVLNGANARGLWVIEIFDLADGVSGTLNAAMLSFAAPAGAQSVQGQLHALTAADLQGATKAHHEAVLGGRGEVIS